MHPTRVVIYMVLNELLCVPAGNVLVSAGSDGIVTLSHVQGTQLGTLPKRPTAQLPVG